MSLKEQDVFTAVYDGDEKRFDALLATGADAKATNEIGQTLLHLAAFYGRLSISRILLERGLQVDARDQDGNTPLIHAACAGQRDLAKLLIAHGADPNAKTDDGWTPLYMAAWHGQTDVAKVLLASGAKPNLDVTVESKPGGLVVSGIENIQTLDSLLRAGVPPAVIASPPRHHRVHTPLHMAVLCEHTDIVDMLLQNGSDVNAKGENDCTPLHTAVSMHLKRLAELLIENGADVNAKNEDGETPLVHALSSGAWYHHYGRDDRLKDMLELLLANGAEYDIEKLLPLARRQTSKWDYSDIKRLLCPGTPWRRPIVIFAILLVILLLLLLLRR